MAAIGVIEFDEGIIAVLFVGITLLALQDLVWRRCSVWVNRLRPAEQIYLTAVSVLCVGAALCRVLPSGRCMTT